MTITNKNLYKIVELIAEKEIERNPIEFIRKESIGEVRGSEFYSYENSDSIGRNLI